MNYFNYRDDRLWCEDVSIEAIAEKVGTPFYLYSHGTLLQHFRVFDAAFRDFPHIICFAVKANANLAIMRLFVKRGAGSTSSPAASSTGPSGRGGPGKDRLLRGGQAPDEIEVALKADILLFNLESSQELEVINERAGLMGKKARVALRINPDIDAQTHPYISTGLKKNKFGIDIERSSMTTAGPGRCRTWRWWGSTATSAPRSPRSPPSWTPWSG